MYYLKKLYITEELLNDKKAHDFKDDMRESFRVYVLPDRIEAFRQELTDIKDYDKESLLMSSVPELLNFARAIGVASIPCVNNDFDNYVGYEFALQDFAETQADYIDKSYRRLKDIPWEVIETKRMIIREETVEDLPALYKLYEGEHIKRFIEPLLSDIRAEEEYVEKYKKYVYRMYEFGIWIAEEKDTHELIGRMGLEPKTYEDDVKGVELGYIIGEKFLRQGYCMEGCRAIIDYARDVLNLPELYVIIKPANEVSQIIAEKLGFIYEKDINDRNRIMKRYKIAFNEQI